MSECKHENTHLGYGYAPSHKHKCMGIGGYVTCEDCGELLEYDLDYEVCDQNEIDWYENSKWNKKRWESKTVETNGTLTIEVIEDAAAYAAKNFGLANNISLKVDEELGMVYAVNQDGITQAVMTIEAYNEMLKGLKPYKGS